MLINVQSLSSKVAHLEVLGRANNLDILCLCEHWARGDQVSNICIEGYKLLSSYCRDTKIHGGTAVYIRKNIACDVTKLVNTKYAIDIHFEYCGIIITSKRGKKVCVLTLYRSPMGSLELFLTNLSLLLSELCPVHDVILCGDLNINSLNETSTEFIALSDLMMSFELTNQINCPTRVVTNKSGVTSASAIDYVVTNNLDNFLRSEVTNVHLSDHLAVFFDFLVPCCTVSESQNDPYEYRRITQNSLQLLAVDLDNAPWEFVENESVDSNFESFLRYFLLRYERHCPMRTCLNNSSESNPWFNKDLRVLKDNLSVAYQMYRETKSISLQNAYNLKRKDYRKQVSSAKRQYISQKISEASNKPKQVWLEVNRKLGRTAGKNKIDSIRMPDGTDTTDSLTIANCFGVHFSESVKNQIGDHFLSQDFPSCTTCDLMQNTIFCEPVTHMEVIAVVKNLKNTSSCGPDGVLVRVLKSVIHSIAVPLSSLINVSFNTGKFPEILKTGKVTAIFKSGDMNDCNNYRPISVLSCFSKILEKLMYARLFSFLCRNNILSNCQHGFRPQRSTETAAVEFVGFISKRMDEGKLTAGVFFDLSKAFDSINIEFVRSKFFNMGIRGTVLDWIVSFLTNRKIATHVNGSASDDYDLDLGVPQGSILGPLIFILFINDLPNHISSGLIINYADDTSIALAGSTLEDLQDSIGLVCEEFGIWCRKNRLILNSNKTNIVVFGRQRIPDRINIVSSENARFLGLLLDREVSWDSHIDLVCSKLNKAYFALLQLRYDLDRGTILQVYYAMVYSAMSYHIIVWGRAVGMNRIFLIQKRIIRLLYNVKKRDSCRPVFKSNNILTIHCIYILKCCLYVRNNLRFFNTNSTYHNYPTRNGSNLLIEQHRTAAYQRSAFYNCARVYNYVPVNIRNINNITGFKNALKKFLVDKCFYSINELFD